MNLIERIKRTAQDWAREDAYWAELEANSDPFVTSDPKSLRMYVLVDVDVLPPLNQGIQAAHAIVEFSTRIATNLFGNDTKDTYYKWAMQDKTLILLGSHNVEDDSDLLRRYHGLHIAQFREPDLGDLVTAAAVEPITKARGEEIFSRMKLAR